MSNKKLCISILFIFLLISSCTPNTQTNNAVFSGESSKVTASEPESASPQPENTNTLQPSPTNTLEPTVVPTIEPLNLSYLGTAIPVSETSITSENYLDLQQTAVWGRGLLSGVAFAPYGDQFVISSPLGFAIYDMAHMEDSPTWVPIDEPVSHQFIAFSEGGNLIKFIGYEGEETIVEFPSGKLVVETEETWLPVAEESAGWGSFEMESSDKALTFTSRATYDEENMNIEYASRHIKNNNTGEEYELKDETIFLEYDDYHLPEGCDVSTTGVCGNAYMPSTFHPHFAAFSPDNETLTIMYRVPNYYSRPDFSLLRIYDTATGKLLIAVGDRNHPISNFAYSPDSSQLLIGFKDGSAQIWSIANGKSIYDSWNFNDYILFAEYTRDGEFLIIQRPGILEIRSPKDGALRSRLETEHYLLSPVDDNIIYFTDDLMIKAMEMDTGKVVLRVLAHDKEILAFSVSPDGLYLASSSLDCKVKLWDAQSGQFLHYLEETIVDGFEGAPPNPDPEYYYNSRIFIKMMEFVEGTDQIIGFGSWGTAVNWNLNSGATNYVIYSAPLQYYQGMMTVNNHFPSNFYVDVEENEFYIDSTTYDLSSGEILRTDHETMDSPENCSIFGPMFEDGKFKFTMGYDRNENKICVLDSETNQLVGIFSPFGETDEARYINGILVSPDGKQLLIADNYDVIEIYTIGN
jgi:WD40 repeat protein